MPETAKPLGVWDVLDRVAGVVRNDGRVDGWHATCPACGKAGMLWVTDDERGELHVRCNGGCTRARVLAALGLDEAVA